MMFDNIDSKLNSAYNEIMPKKLTKVNLINNCNKPWLTQSILKSIRHKDKLFKTYLKNKTCEFKASYKKYKTP